MKRLPSVAISKEKAVVALPSLKPKVTMQPEAMSTFDFDFDLISEREPPSWSRDPFKDVNMNVRQNTKNYSPFKPKHIMPNMERNDMIDELLADLEEDLRF